MRKEEIKTKLTQIFRDVFDDDELEIFDEMTAQDVDEWDSFSNVEMITALESEFNITFAISEVQGLENVGDLIKLLEKKLG